MSAQHLPFRIVEAPVPDALDSPDLWALRGVTDLEHAMHVEIWGYPDLAESLRACWAWARNETYGRRLHLVALDGDGEIAPADPARVLGSLSVHLPNEHNTHLVEAFVTVRESARGRGIGTALAERAEAIAREAGRRLVMSWSDHAAEPPEPTGPDDAPVLRPSTGSGRIPDDAASRFARRHGYALEQAERHSVMDLPVDGALLAGLEAQAVAGAGTDYRVVTWTDAAPEKWLDAYGVLFTRMSTDVPLGGLDVEEDVWDAGRVRDFEATHAEAGHRLLVAAAEHVPTGALAAFTVLVVRPGTAGDPDAVFQDSTLALKEHRGHRLGMLVKVANVRAVQAAFPNAERIHTWNAEENEHMLAINVAMGFRPAGISAAWQKHLV